MGASKHPLEHYDSSSNRQYYELDLAGNVRRLRAPGGADLGGYRYTAFGGSITDATAPTAPTGVNALPVRWKGRWLMYSTGSGAGLVELYDMRARWWWPQGGVFVQVDDFDFQDPTSTLWGWPNQNPYRYSDPSGHDGTAVLALGQLFGGGASTAAGGGTLAASEFVPPVLIATVAAAAVVLGEAGIDSAFAAQNQAALDAQAADFAAFTAALNSRLADLSVQDNEYSREAKRNAGTQGDPITELEKIREKLRQTGGLTPEIERKINQAEKFLGGRNKTKRQECK